jgi:hypothetical protein
MPNQFYVSREAVHPLWLGKFHSPLPKHSLRGLTVRDRFIRNWLLSDGHFDSVREQRPALS